MAEQITDPAILAQLNGTAAPASKSKGTPITDPETLAALNSDMHPDDAGALHYIRSALQAADPWVRSIANGATFGLADRLAAGMGAATGVGGTGGDYAGNLKNEQAKTDQFAKDHPIVNAVAQTGGALATLPLAPAARAVEGLSLGAKTLAGMGAGATIGGVGGALNSKDYTDLPQTMKDAAFGAGAGALLGGTVPVVGQGVGKGLNWLADAVRRTPGISRDAAAPLIKAMQTQGPQETLDALDRLGPDATPADTGEAMLGTAQGAAGNDMAARNTMASKFIARDKGTNARLEADRNAALGPYQGGDPQSVSDAILAHRTAQDNINYPAALDNAPDVKTAPILTQLDYRIKNSVGMEKKALQSLRDMMMKTERQPMTDAAGIQQYDSMGQPRFRDVPVSQNDANVLHNVKGELDNVINYDAPGLGVPAGALSRKQGVLKWFRGQLNDALENQVPGYREANDASSALAKHAEAVKAGTQYLGSGKTTPSPERFASEFDPLDQGTKIAFAKGSRGEIERVFGTKANDLQALSNELQGEGGWNTAKIANVHGQDAADQLVSSLNRNKTFRNTYQKVVEGSQTDLRNAARKEMKPDPSTETPLINPNMSLTGITGTLGKKAVTGIANALLHKDPAKSYAEIAKILSSNGPEARAYLNALKDTINRRAAISPTLNRLGDRAALAGAIGGGRLYVGRPSTAQTNTQ